MRTINPWLDRFPWCALERDTAGDIVTVILPSYNHVSFLSPETEVCPSLYRNLERRDQVFNDHVKAYKQLESLPKAHDVERRVFDGVLRCKRGVVLCRS